jgi:hypothetical protein
MGVVLVTLGGCIDFEWRLLLADLFAWCLFPW